MFCVATPPVSQHTSCVTATNCWAQDPEELATQLVEAGNGELISLVVVHSGGCGEWWLMVADGGWWWLMVSCFMMVNDAE